MIKSQLALFTKSIEFASRKHTSQRRKNGDIPYINHPIEVANFLAQAGVHDYDVLCAAILHDTVQDTDTTPQELEKEFGQKIKNIVLQCSDDKSLSKVQRKRAQIKHALQVSNEAKLVKSCDKLSNNFDLLGCPPKGWSQERVKGYFVWSMAVCKNLKGINESIDKKMEQLFQKAGVSNMQEKQLNEKLEEYYKILAK